MNADKLKELLIEAIIKQTKKPMALELDFHGLVDHREVFMLGEKSSFAKNVVYSVPSLEYADAWMTLQKHFADTDILSGGLVTNLMFVVAGGEK
jgi:hypothetical protein